MCRDFEDEAGRHLWRTLTIHTLGQGYDEARDHVTLKIGVLRKQLQHVREISLGIYSGHCTFWRSEHEVQLILAEFFHLLGKLSLNVLSINLDAYGPAVIPSIRSFQLPDTLTHLTISNGMLPNLGFLQPCLHKLESLKLRSVSHAPYRDNLSLEPLLPGSVLPKLRDLEVDRAVQLHSLRGCALPALENLSVVTLCRDGLEILFEYLLSLSLSSQSAIDRSTQSRYAVDVPTLQTLSLRISNKPDIRPTPSMIHSGLLLHPMIKSSGILSNIHTLTLVHDVFPDQHSQDESLFDLISAFPKLRQLNWDVLLDWFVHHERLQISDHILEALFGHHVRERVNGTMIKEIQLRAMVWRIMRSQKSWVRRYVGKGHDSPGDQSWAVVDDTRML